MKQYTVCDKRIEQIDIAKAIDIILTILAHNLDYSGSVVKTKM